MSESIYHAKLNISDYLGELKNKLYIIVDKLLFLCFTERHKKTRFHEP